MTDEELTVERLSRLTQANAIRFARADDKKKLRRGELDASTILRDLPNHWRSAHVVDLLLAMQRVGRIQAQRWLRIEDIDSTRMLGDLTLRQRVMLAKHIDVWMERRARLRAAGRR